MHDRNTAREIHGSNSYRNFAETAPETGTLEHRLATPFVADDSGVPVSLAGQAETGTLEHGTALFVSTALESWTGLRKVFVRDVQINDIAYRRLDPEYYAWLRSRMNLARSAHQAGQIDTIAYDELRARFNAVHEWAMEHFGERSLADAVCSLDARDYRPPVAEPDNPADSSGKRNGIASNSAEAVAIVDAICDCALALGWKRERLYTIGKGIFDPRRGLICYLKPGDRIGEVTLQSIEIIHPPPSEVRHRFYNPDVDQPWIRRITTSTPG